MPAHTANKVPSFIYGTAWKEERTASLTELGIRNGFRAIDTANQRRHYYEAGVGEGLRAVYEAGVVTRNELFLQTKFTYQRGQDHRLPYDPSARLSEQVKQSLASSLEHLGTDYVDSFVLHGPASNYGWSAADSEAWEAMRSERDAGRASVLGVSNVGLWHLEKMAEAGEELPHFVQNRCFARSGWDRELRRFCVERNIVYQGFSLLTANVEVFHHPTIGQVAASIGATLAQVIFAVARAIGILPLTGTSDAKHMREDLASLDLTLPPGVVEEIESLVG
jgi:diketogulonate reductase-like aldo/keto reductase